MTGRSRWALMAAFAVDNYGSGLFLPLALLYSFTLALVAGPAVVGLLAVAGWLPRLLLLVVVVVVSLLGFVLAGWIGTRLPAAVPESGGAFR